MTKKNNAAEIMNESDIERALIRISHEIVEKNRGTENLCLVGIKTRGVPLAEKIAKNIYESSSVKIPVGALDITLYRDDLSRIGEEPVINSTSIDFPIDKKIIVLVDDVIYTCRTARAAMDAVIRLGRPDRIYLAVLIDRGHSELPIRPNFVGRNIPTAQNEVVSVKLQEIDGEQKVLIYKKQTKK